MDQLGGTSSVVIRLVNGEQVALRLFLTASICVGLCCKGSVSPLSQSNQTDALAHQLSVNFNDTDKRGILVMDLSPPDGQSSSFGQWLADELSSSFANEDPPIQVIDRARLATELAFEHLSHRDEFTPQNAFALSKAVGATTIVLGSYGAATNGIGISLRACRVSEFGFPNSTKFEIGRVFGKIQLTEDVSNRLGVPLNSLRPPDGIYEAGQGGVTVPSCVKCRPPDMHIPDIDLQRLLHDKGKGWTIVLRFVVTVDGHASQITVTQAVGYGVDEQFVKAAEAWEFTPALDAFARKMQNKVAGIFGTSPEVTACLARVRAELEKRGRKDLLV